MIPKSSSSKLNWLLCIKGGYSTLNCQAVFFTCSKSIWNVFAVWLPQNTISVYGLHVRIISWQEASLSIISFFFNYHLLDGHRLVFDQIGMLPSGQKNCWSSGLWLSKSRQTSPLACLDLRKLLSLSPTAGHSYRLVFVLLELSSQLPYLFE